AIVNAIVGSSATGGSTNHVIHSPAIARAAGVQIDWNDMDELSRVVPSIASVYPNGAGDVNYFHAAGGMPYVIRESVESGSAHADIRTVYDQSSAEGAQEPVMDGETSRWNPAPQASAAARSATSPASPAKIRPVKLIRHSIGVLISFLITGIVLAGGAQFVLHSLMDSPRDSHVYQMGMMSTGLVIILVALRALFQPSISRYAGPDGDDTHGSARFATDRETRTFAQNGDGSSIGRDRKSGKSSRYAGPSHSSTIAPTRTGKGVGTIIPNSLDYPGPVVCIDPKGENARITARHRAKFGPV
ncbi:hypothetical protein OY671_008175, partial [Metschnikowia pulcherrima]